MSCSPIVEDARFEGAARHLQIDLVAGELPKVRANAELLHRAIGNIVRNAVRHSPDGATLCVEAATVGNGFRLAVLDQGPGVPAVDLENIFQPFFRGSGQPAGSGHGLGLAIAKRVVTMLNGKIGAENRPGGGLVVEVLLPQA